MYYTASDVALIGGSLLPFGGQNLIEASALGKPVLFGPYMFNFTQASEAALMHGAAIQIFDETNLSQKMVSLLQDKTMQAKMALAATEFANTYRGATANTMKILQPFLDTKLY
jgi:3-deoxy-D-manno-octulosonic-acid transferase